MTNRVMPSHTVVLGAVEDRIAETHRLPSVSELERTFGAGVRRVVDQLIEKRSLMVVFQGPSLPQVVAPRYMFEEALRQQRRPKWMVNYRLPGRDEVDQRVARDRAALSRFDEIERLLYSTGDPLEDAVGVAVRELGFEDVSVMHDPNDCDVRFALGGIRFLAEAKGKTSQLDKDDVLQLSGWIKQEVEKGSEPETLRGVVVANQQRLLAPPERGDALTTAADRFARLHEFGIWTAASLFEAVRAVLRSADPDAERARIRNDLVNSKYLKKVG